MKRIEYRTVDKSEWAVRGPWDHEPDKLQWQDEETSLPCLIVRGPAGALCGYVGVPKDHPLHGKDYDPAYDALYTGDQGGVHGGLTFSGPCTDASRANWEKARARLRAGTTKEEIKRFPIGDAARWVKTWKPFEDDYEGWVQHVHATAICHVPEGDEPDDIWWFGFDCAHAGDFCPEFESYREKGLSRDEQYRDLNYVTKECQRLAQALKLAINDYPRFNNLMHDD
jgi:hypothetical protein